VLEAKHVAHQLRYAAPEAIQTTQAVFPEREKKVGVNVLSIDGARPTCIKAFSILQGFVIQKELFKLVEEEKDWTMKDAIAGDQEFIQPQTQIYFSFFAGCLRDRF
jgi:hypothetical protein